MAKSDRKLHEARMAGAAWLMNVIKTQGMEAAEKELKTRGAMFVPLEVNQKQLDEFDFGQKRLDRFCERFNSKTEAICDGDIIWDDLIQTLKEETGLDFTIRENK